MRRLVLALACGAALSAPAHGAGLADCDGPHETVLVPSPTGTLPARAAWLDAQRLRWAGVGGGDGQIRLLASRTGQVSLTLGQPPRGADRSLVLEPVEPPAGTGAGSRFSHIGPGVTLAVRESDRRLLQELHRGELVLVQVDAAGNLLRASRVQAAGALDALYPAAREAPDLGAVLRRQGARFRLWAPTAQRVQLCLYRGAESRASALRTMRRDARTGVWTYASPTRLDGRYYRYLVDVFVPGVGLVRNLVTDPYALSLSADSRRAQVLDLDAPSLKPAGWGAERPPQRVPHPVDMSIYELHVRDFSAGDDSVPPAHRGTYLAFTHEGSRGMRHLRALADAGLTDVHLLPVFDLASVPERGCRTPAVPRDAAPDSDAQQAAVMREADGDCFNWGYDPWHYTAPEGSYATDANDGRVRVRELRAMVQALNRAGLRAGMDMVYNHTTASGQHPKSVLDRIVPGYYHRLDANGAVERSTCCDNTATEHMMMERLMIDSAVTWARHYRIDSMRFDLMGHQPRAAMERLARAVDAAVAREGRRIDLIGEGWNFGEVKDGARFVQASQGSLNGSRIGTFTDRGRDAARGSPWGAPEEQLAATGWLHANGNAAQTDVLRVALAGTLVGREPGYASQPAEVVNYVENHDNQTLFDNNATKLPRDTSREDRARVQHLGNALVAFSQGIAYFHAGQELLRSKSLDRNSFDSGDWFNRLDFSLQDNGFGAGLPPAKENQGHWRVMRPLLADARIKPTPAEIAWTRDAFLDLLRIRASTSMLRLRSADEIARRLSFVDGGRADLIALRIDGQGLAGANFRELVLLLSPTAQPLTHVAEPLRGRALELHPVLAAPGAADRRAAGATYDAVEGRFSVPPRAAVVFVGR